VPSGGSGGSATNAVATISSNGVPQVTSATNLDFWPGANITIGPFTNRSGHADVPIALTQNPTNLGSITFSNGSSIIPGAPTGAVSAWTNANAGGGYQMILWTNGQLYILAGISNAAFATPGILTNDGNGKFYSTFPLPKGSSDLGYATNETTRQVLNSTNSPALVYGATTAIGAQFATNDSTGTALLTRFQQGTNEVTRQVLNATNSPAVVAIANLANNLLSTANVNKGSETGGVSFAQFDASSFMTNGVQNSNAVAYVVPSAGSGGLQGSAPLYFLLPLSSISTAAGTNQWLNQLNLPPNWNSNAVNLSVEVFAATNLPTTATSMVFSASISWNGSALATPITVTNNIPVSTGFISTNIELGPFPVTGTSIPNEPLVIQWQYWSVGNGRITNNSWVSSTRCYWTNSVQQNGLVTGW